MPSALTLELSNKVLNIEYISERTVGPVTSPGLEYEDIYDWLVSVRKTGDEEIVSYMLRCITDGWVEIDPVSMEEFLERNYL